MAKPIVRCPSCATQMNNDDCGRVDGKWVEKYSCLACGKTRNIVAQQTERPSVEISPKIPPEEFMEQFRPKSVPPPDPDPPYDPPLVMGEEPDKPTRAPETMFSGGLPSVDEFEALAEARRILEETKRIREEIGSVAQHNGFVPLEVMLERAMILYRDSLPDFRVKSRNEIEEQLRDSEWWFVRRQTGSNPITEYPLA